MWTKASKNGHYDKQTVIKHDYYEPSVSLPALLYLEFVDIGNRNNRAPPFMHLYHQIHKMKSVNLLLLL
jgi:hypothetical protein